MGVSLALTLVSLVTLGIISVRIMSLVTQAAEQSSLDLGRIAADDSASALTALGEEAMRQKAVDVANQVRIFLEANPEPTGDDFTELAGIAVQTVGQSGYTLMYSRQKPVMVFHLNPDLVGFDLMQWADDLPAFWRIFEAGLSGQATGGYYDWFEPDGSTRQKYMYVAPVSGTHYMIGATIYMDEFRQPSEDIRSRILSAASATERFIAEQQSTMQTVFVIAIALILAAVGGLSWLFSRLLGRPIRVLTDGANRIRSGDLSYRVTVKTGDEIEDLAGQFNSMTGALQRSYSVLEQRVEERTRAEKRRSEQLRAINEVARRISTLKSVEELLADAVRSLQEAFNYYNVAIFLLDQNSGELTLKAVASAEQPAVPGIPRVFTQGIAHWVATAGAPLVANDVSKEKLYVSSEHTLRTTSELAVPIRLSRDILGVLDIQSADRNTFDDLDLSTATTVADFVGITLENARLYQDIRDVAVLEERNRLAREIHDTLAQGFVGIVLQLEAAEQALSKSPAEAEKHINRARGLARDSLKEARRSVQALRPQPRERLPLAEAIRQEVTKFTELSEVKATLDISGNSVELAPDVEDSVLRIAQEAMTNVRRHANASDVTIGLHYQPGRITLTVRDNGIGFDPRAPGRGTFGLVGIRERVRLLGGQLEITSEPSHGTLVRVLVPTDRG